MQQEIAKARPASRSLRVVASVLASLAAIVAVIYFVTGHNLPDLVGWLGPTHSSAGSVPAVTEVEFLADPRSDTKKTGEYTFKGPRAVYTAPDSPPDSDPPVVVNAEPAISSIEVSYKTYLNGESLADHKDCLVVVTGEDETQQSSRCWGSLPLSFEQGDGQKVSISISRGTKVLYQQDFHLDFD